jgi:diguanylate cyclase (GGDEF)-like protein
MKTMEDETQVLSSTPKPPAPLARPKGYLVHIYPTGPNMGTRYSLGDRAVTIGREPDCDILINDESVSRRHASIASGPEGYVLADLHSTNGTFINDHPVSQCLLKDGDYVHIGGVMYRFLASTNIEAAYHEEIYRLTIIDALTEIHNKRYFLEHMAKQLACSVRYRRPLALIMVDVDRFKEINDRLGHICGDYTLRELASRVRNGLRREDLFARYGGEEFVVLLPETSRDGAMQTAERLRQAVEVHPFHYDGCQYPVTISLGVSATTGEQWLTSNELIEQADTRLYQAKRHGRNCVVGE